MSIRAKLILAFAILVSLILTQGVIDYWRSTRVTGSVMDAFRNSAREMEAANGMIDAAHELAHLLERPDAYHSPQSERVEMLMASFDERLEDALRATRDFAETAVRPGGPEREEEELALLRAARVEFDALGEKIRTGEARTEVIGRLEHQIEPILREYRAFVQGAVTDEIDVAQAAVAHASRTMIVAIAVSVLVAIAACVAIGGMILHPLRQLTTVTREIADGDHSRRLKLRRTDEFAEVESHFNRMLDALDEANVSKVGLESVARSRASELDRLFGLSIDLLAVSTMDGQFVRVSDSFHRTLGYHGGELMQRPFMEFVHPDDAAETAREMARLREGKPVLRHENRFRSEDGSWVTLAWTAAPMREDGLIYAVARDITQERCAQEMALAARERSLEFERSLLRLRDAEAEDVEGYCRFATEICAATIGVERVGIWFFSDDHETIECADLFRHGEGVHESGRKLRREEFPAYFEAIGRERAVVAEDARSNPSTSQLTDGYLNPEGVRALLDVPIRTGDRLEGILCCEHVGSERSWDAEEERFARSAAGYVMLAIETVRGRRIQEDIQRLNATLEQRIADRTAQLAENEQRFRHIIEQVQDYAIIVLDPDGRVASWNAGAARLKGFSVEEIMGRDSAVFYTKEDREAGLPAKLLQGARERGRSRDEGWRLRKDGTRFWAEVFLSAHRDPAGNLRGYAKITHDLTERRRAERELREREEQFRAAMENSAIGMALVSPDGRWVRVNRALCGILGYSADELLEIDFQTITYPEDLGRDLGYMRQLIDGEIANYHMEKRYIHKDGHLVWAMLSVSLVKDEDGGAKYFISQIQDVTDRREAEDALRHALEKQKRLAHEARAGERAKSEFLAVMSHEVRTPMNGVLGFADLLANMSDLPSEARDYAETIVRSGSLLLRILDDILDLSRLEAGRLAIQKKPFSLGEMLREIVLLLTPGARNRGISVSCDIDPSLPDHYLGDAGRLRQVMLNLAGNAIKFTEVGGVTLGARWSSAPRGSIELFVRDTGCGIPAAQLESVFEPFVQVDSSASRRYGGAGLGLAISKRLVDLMGGALRVSSRENEGTEFVATVPLEKADDAAEAVAETNGSTVPIDEVFVGTHPLRILVAEDDRVNSKLIVTMLRKFGFQPLSADDGMAAVEVFQAERPDCILMDLQMPRMDGIAATARIREIEAADGLQRTFIMALTANTSPVDRERCMEAGMDDYLNKPVKRDALAKALSKAVRSTTSVQND